MSTQASARLSPATVLLLTIPPLMWAGNVVVGRMLSPHISPVTLNFIRWGLAFLILLPLAWRVVLPGSGLWASWKRFTLLGLLVGCYNALQYMALETSSPLNITLVASSSPIWMMAIGRLFFAAPISRRQGLGAVLSMLGVALVLSRGELDALLNLRLVVGDVYILIATLSWAYYSWMLTQKNQEPAHIRNDWSAFLLSQIVFGMGWAGVFAAGEWAADRAFVHWSWPTAAGILFVALGPALLAYRCWGAGVQRAGPAIASFFSNLTPLFAALGSLALLGEMPQFFHVLAFAFIVGGIVVSSKRSK
ncbi:MAG: DMT family transporter [Betaproteobacteria bacterium]|nr:DMT family transporter [Betaproteobacteria bacterium]